MLRFKSKYLSILLFAAQFAFASAFPFAALAEEHEPPASPDAANESDVLSVSEGENASGAEELSVENGDEPVTEEIADVRNEAVLENDVETSADTGGESAAGEEGEASVETGNASAAVNLVNMANTNIIDSVGAVLFANFFERLAGHLDLRQSPGFPGVGSAEARGTTSCPLPNCSEGDRFVAGAENGAEIVNDVVVRATTGTNAASGESARIGTGDAYAAANVVNMANTNIIRSNYLLLTLNHFGDWEGDLVFPPARFFRDVFFRQAAGVAVSSSSSGRGDATTTIELENSAEVENDVSVGAGTGGNSADASATSSVRTGDARAAANVVNQVNENLIGGGSFRILLRVIGSWSGNLFGVPSGVSWQETDAGIMLIGDSDAEEEGGDTSIDEQREEPLGGMSGTTTPPVFPADAAFASVNDARVANRVSVMALTGENEASGSTGEAFVETGNASAAVNVVNIVNTNVIGRNWLLAVINVLGNWNGNLSFGRPDLWIGSRAETEGTPGPGSRITYRFTVMNNGDADATGVTLENEFDSDRLSFVNAASAFQEDNRTRWDLGTIAPGGMVELSYAANVHGDIDFGTTAITNTATVHGNETDENGGDNIDTLSVVVYRKPPESGTYQNPKGPTGSLSPDIVLEKTASTTGPFTAPAAVDYKIVIRNEGNGPAYDTVLTDVLRDANDKVIKRQSWDLGEIIAGEEITVSYTMAFNANAVAGIYTNTAELSGYKGFPAPVGDDLMVPAATYRITLLAPEPNEEILSGGSADEPEEQFVAGGGGSGSGGTENPTASEQSSSGGSAPAPSPSPAVTGSEEETLERQEETLPDLEAAEPASGVPGIPRAPVAFADARFPGMEDNARPTFLAAIAYAGYEAPFLGVLAILGGIALFFLRRKGKRSMQ